MDSNLEIKRLNDRFVKIIMTLNQQKKELKLVPFFVFN